MGIFANQLHPGAARPTWGASRSSGRRWRVTLNSLTLTSHVQLGKPHGACFPRPARLQPCLQAQAACPPASGRLWESLPGLPASVCALPPTAPISAQLEESFAHASHKVSWVTHLSLKPSNVPPLLSCTLRFLHSTAAITNGRPCLHALPRSVPRSSFITFSDIVPPLSTSASTCLQQ